MEKLPTLQELLDELATLDRLLKESRDAFLQANAAYDAVKSTLEEQLIDHLKPYREQSRARFIQKFAEELELSSKDFFHFSVNLMSAVALLGLGLDLRVSGPTTRVMAEYMNAVSSAVPIPPVPADQEPIKFSREFFKSVSPDQTRVTLIVSEAVLIGRKAIDAQRLAAYLIQL